MSNRKVPWDDVGEAGVTLPEYVYKLKIESLEEKISRTNKAMIAGEFRVVEPKNYRNVPLREWFVIGTDDDPNCDDPATWSQTVGARRLKTLLKKAKVTLTASLARTLKAAEGNQFIALITQEIEEEGKYKGRINNRISGFFSVGERRPGPTTEPEDEEEDEDVEEVSDEDEDEEEEEEEEEEDDDDEDEEEEEEPKRPTRRARRS